MLVRAMMNGLLPFRTAYALPERFAFCFLLFAYCAKAVG